MGYHEAGFDVVGVDLAPQPRYPFEFIHDGALKFVKKHGHEFDAIHARPPCQRFSAGSRIWPGTRLKHPDLIDVTRAALVRTRRPYVIENVPGSSLSPFSVMLCGLQFGLRVFRHRFFEGSFLLMRVRHKPHAGRRIGADGYCCVAGHGDANFRHRKSDRRSKSDGARVPNTHRRIEMWRTAMGIDWMTRDEITQAIPPAYTEFIGRQLLAVVAGRRMEATSANGH